VDGRADIKVTPSDAMQTRVMHTAPRIRRALAPLLLLVAGTSCGPGESRERDAGRLVPAVEAVQARHGTLPLIQRLSGVVRAMNQVEIYPEIDAVVAAVLVEDGDAVERGDPLVRLRDTEFRQRLKQARASLEIARAQLRRARALARESRAELERLQTLTARGLASQADLDAGAAGAESAEADVELAEARVDQAQASAEEQEENLTRTVLRAPISGRVGNRHAEVGMLARSGTGLVTIGQLDSLRVEVALTDRMLADIEAGQRAEVSAAGTTVSARLSRISPFLDPVAHSTDAEIDLANADGALRPGMFVTVDVYYGESEEATLVPLSALYEDPATGVTGVYATDSDLGRPPFSELGSAGEPSLTDPVPFTFRAVEVIAQGRMETAVRAVEPGTWVVSLGQNLLGGETPEARVRPVPWQRVEHLQRLQRDDLMREVIEPQSLR
jgi:RND family efflux transporter MFP subunit